MSRVQNGARGLLHLMGPRLVRWIALGMAMALALAGIELVVARVLQSLLAALGLAQQAAPDATARSGSIGALLLAVALLRAAAQFVVQHSGVMAVELLAARMRLVGLHRLLSRPERTPISAAEAHHYLSEVVPKAAAFVFNLSMALPALVQASALAVLICLVAPREAGLGLVGLCFTGALVLRLNQLIRPLAARIPVAQAQVTRGIERVGRNALLLRIMRTGALEHERLARATLDYTRSALGGYLITNVVAQLPAVGGLVLLLGILVVSLERFDTPGPALVTFLYLFVRFVQLCGVLANTTSMLTTYAPQLRQALSWADDLSPEEFERAVTPPKSLRAGTTGESASDAPRRPPPRIDIRALGFRYGPEAPWLLRGLNLEVPSGAQAVVVGRTGGGKSTLLALIMGVLQPTEGGVTVDGVPAGAAWVRQGERIGYVGPEPFLIEGTVRENLLYGLSGPTPTDEDIREALEVACLGDVIRALPDGLEHRIPENADNLSAGQKQRLALARAFLRQPRLLVLDEVSANLDPETEAEVVESLRRLKGSVTIVVVTHRRALLEHADVLLDLDLAARSDREAVSPC